MKPQNSLLKKWRLALILLALFPAFVNTLFFSPGEIQWFVCTGAWVLTFLFFYLFYLPIRWRRLSFQMTGDRIVVRTGVFYNQVLTIPLENVQFTSLVASPLDLLFRITSLVVVAPGGRVILPGLLKKDAMALADVLTPTQQE